jgi:myo-inositol-1(or 4)-monophosphatase
VNDADVAVAAAEAGAAVVRSWFGRAVHRIDKGGVDLATQADVEAEAAILAVLRRLRPDDAVVGEESGQSGPAGAARCWLVDPLCGTVNFAAGTGPVAVNVALCEGDRTVAAAVADPLSGFGVRATPAGELWWSDGERAHGRPAPPVPTAVSGLVDLNLDGPFPNSPAFRTVALAADPAFAATFRPRVMSTTLALAWVACGRRAAYVTDGDLAGSVHFTAPLELCRAAGCTVTNLVGGPVHTGVGGVVAAADGDTHARLLAVIAGIVTSTPSAPSRASG